MAKQRTNYPKSLPRGAPAAPNASPETETVLAPAEGASEGFPVRFWIGLYVTGFVLVMTAVLGLFVVAGGDSKTQRKMLQSADTLRAEGKYLEANEVLEAFGERWPGALETHNWRLKVGLNALDAGDTEKAAENLTLAVKHGIRANLTIRDTRALAGSALWKVGRKDEAAAMFREELEKGNPDSDMSRYYLGLYDIEHNNLVDAFKQFEAIRDREAYAADIEKSARLVDEKYLEPARVAARTAS